MIEQEEWQCWSARASVLRTMGCTVVDVRGVVTAAAFEALHLRLAAERANSALLILDWPALLALTGISAVEAATRGTPGRRARALPITLLVPAARLKWAREFCNVMTGLGACRSVAPLERRRSQWTCPARQAA